jgi:hypothetical protein
MAEETAVQESSPVEVEDVFQGKNVSMAEFSKYRTDGELPARFKPIETEEAASSSDAETEVEAETAGDSETPETKQELPKPKPKQTAEERIAQLEATIEKIRKGKGIETPAASSPAPKPVQQQQPGTRSKPTAEDKKDDGTPKFQTYEDFVEDLADWKSEQREVAKERLQRETEQATRTHGKVEEAKARYEDFAEVVGPTVDAIVGDADISPVVKKMLDDSDMFADLIYTIGSDPAELAKFVKMAKESPGKAIRYIALTESFIAEALEGKKAKPAEEAPAKPKTNAPKPPSPVGGASSRAFDVSDDSLSADEWMRKRNKQLGRI